MEMKDCNRYRIQVGAYCSYNKAMDLQLLLCERGLTADIIRKDCVYTVNTGNFTDLDRAVKMEYYLKSLGYQTMLVQFA